MTDTEVVERKSVKDIMVPLDEYVTVPEHATLFEAVEALEKTQEELDRKQYKYLHRAVLVYDSNKRIVGKVSQLDALRALEPKYGQMGDPATISRAGFSPEFLKDLITHHSLWSQPLRALCGKAGRLKVKDFMYTPTEGEHIDENATLEEGIHQLVMGHHHSLLVTRNGDIVGVLRLTDVFAAVSLMMKQCEL